MRVFRYLIAFGFLTCSLLYSQGSQDVYAADITVYPKFLPERFMLVNKKKQECFLYDKSEVVKYICSTGQVDGDKQYEGDKKTPEGLYFVTSSIPSPDYDEYGTKAFPLNYPNPIDVLEKKTGYGIWLHGRGRKFELQDTRGCVAFPESEILKIHHNFTKGYPVIIADTVTYATSKNTVPVEYAQVEKSLQQWSDAWSKQSSSFFALYDAVLYPNFIYFKKNKERIFSLFPFTYSLLEKTYIVNKGAYYITWFKQYYYAPNLLVEGTRYLYWKNENGALKIVAEVWNPGTTSATEKDLQERIVPKIQAFLNGWKQAWEKANIVEYSKYYTQDAVQGNIRSKSRIMAVKQALWDKQKPHSIQMENMRVALTSKGIRVTFKQRYQATNYTDVGTKIVYILPLGNDISEWRIQKEEWRK